MPRKMPSTALGLMVFVAGCTASGAATATSRPTASLSQNDEATCQGVNAQDLDVPQPARGFGLAWNETDDGARMAILEEIWADDATHVQPEMEERLVGREAFSEHIGAFHANRPGEYFEWRDWQPSNLHHDRVLLPWRLCAADGTTVLVGTDFGLIGPDGRLLETTGFYPPE